jgi:hypothetical protein
LANLVTKIIWPVFARYRPNTCQRNSTAVSGTLVADAIDSATNSSAISGHSHHLRGTQLCLPVLLTYDVFLSLRLLVGLAP